MLFFKVYDASFMPLNSVSVQKVQRANDFDVVKEAWKIY